MGCTISIPSEQDGGTAATIKHPNGHSIINEAQKNASCIKPIDSNEEDNDFSDDIADKPDDYESILSSPGHLEIPDKFVKWFPPRHGHRNIRKLFKWNAELGHGVTGSVYEIEYKQQICAIKQVEKNDQWGRMLFTTEARVLSKLKHCGIIGFIDMFFDDKYYYLVLEKADFDLYYVMKKKGHLSERKTRNITYALLKAISYMHRKNLAHRDLKPENIVFLKNDTDNPRLIDFGDAEMAKKDKIYTEFVGTPPYMSPERLDEHKGWQLKKADIWAIAVIAFEMYCGCRCFQGETQKQVFGRIIRGEWEWPSDRKPSDNMMNFVESCLKHDAKERPTANQALSHQWFAKKRQEEEEKKQQLLKPIISTLKLGDDASSAITPDDEAGGNNNITFDKLKNQSVDIMKLKDIPTLSEHGLTNIFENLASLVQSNALQELLIQGYANKLHDDDLAPFKEQFDKLDSDRDGYITGIDLVNAFTSNGIGPNQASSLASIIISQLSSTRNGKVSFDQFLAARLKYDLSNRPREIFDDICNISSSQLYQLNHISSSPNNNNKNINGNISPQIQHRQIDSIKENDEFSQGVSIGLFDSEYSQSGIGVIDHHDDDNNNNNNGYNHNNNNNRCISQQDLIIYSKSHSNLKVCEQDLREIFEQFDKDKDGRLTFSDFVQAVYSTRVVDAPLINDHQHILPKNKKCHSKSELLILENDDVLKDKIIKTEQDCYNISRQHSL